MRRAPRLARGTSHVLGEEEVRGTPEVIAVVSGVAKQEAVRAALRGGLVHSLVTDAELARTLIDQP